jgi:hypothetical protein
VVNGNGIIPAEEVTIRQATEAASGAVREMTAPPADHVTLSNGVSFKLKAVSGLLIRRAVTQVPKPEVPMWFNEDRGRDEPNPNHPDYLAELERYDETTGMAAMNVMFLVGTKVVHPLPPDIPALEDAGWLDELNYLGIDAKTDGPGRYLDWLKYVVLSSPEDMVTLSVSLGRLCGLGEGDVTAALNSFRRGEGRGTNSGSPASDAGDGDSLQPVATGQGAGD